MRFQRTLWIDTAAPEITLDTLKGTEVWYDAGMDLSVAADDGKMEARWRRSHVMPTEELLDGQTEQSSV